MSVEFGEKSVGQHGANIFYKEFTVSYNSNYKTYRLGSFYFVRKAPNPVTIAEFQLIWKNTYSGKKYASVKLYFNPEDDDEDEEDYVQEFGKDEVIEADRQVVIECSEFPIWECTPKLWNKKIGEFAFADIPKEYLKKFIKEEHLPIDCRDNIDVKIISYPQYCRFKTCLKMIKVGLPMTLKVFIARGGLLLKNINTIILFSRWKFSKSRIDDFSLTRNITVPVFKGRPRKKKRRELMLLKKRKQKLLMKEMKLWKLSSTNGMKRKYNKSCNKDNSIQDGHSSVSSAASRILKKYKKKNEKAELAAKKEDVAKSLKIAQQRYFVPKGRKATDGRLKVNKLKKAALLNNIEVEKKICNNEITNKECVSNEQEDSDKNDVTKCEISVKVEDKPKSESVDDTNRMLEPKEMFAEISSREEFIKELYAFMSMQEKPILKIPSMGHAQVDFYDLYTLVVKYGGYAQVTLKRQWREIYDGLGRHSNDITNAATSVRKIYENMLLLYENKMRKKDMPLQEKSGVEKVSVKVRSEPSKISLATVASSKEYKRNSIENKPIPLENIPMPCEYKRISSTEKYVNKPVPITYVSTENNIVQKFTNRDILPKGDVSSPLPLSQTAKNHISRSQNSGTTSFTLQAGEAFKLMIQKRRGRPSKDFRKQIEQLKTMNRKVEVEVFPPIGKRTRLPTWLNDLNVDIVNPRRKRKLSAAGNNYVNSNVSGRYVNPKIEITSLPKVEISRVTNVSHLSYVKNFNESGSSTPSILKIDTPSIFKVDTLTKSPNGFPEILPKSPNGYVSMVAINSEDKAAERLMAKDNNKDIDRCEFSIKSVRSLAKSPLSPKPKSQSYVHYPSSHPITIPQSVLSYNEYRPKHISSPLNRINEPSNVAVSRYPISSSLSTNELTSQTYRKEDLSKQDVTPSFVHISEVRMKNPTSMSFDSKITGPNIRQIYFPNNEKRIYTSNHRLSDEDIKRENVHMEKVYLHHPSHLRAPNGKSKHEPMTHFPHNMTLIPAQNDPKISASNLTFHSYIPPSDVYMSPTSTIYKSISGACKNSGKATVSKPSFENHRTAPVEPRPPKVYILPPERTWVVPRTSV